MDLLRRAIESTRLNFGLTATEVEALVSEAERLGCGGVCVPVRFLVPARAARSAGVALDLVTVANFPTGDHTHQAILLQVRSAIASGAAHVDVVVPGSLVAERDWAALERFFAELGTCARTYGAPDLAFKAILETAAWDEDRIRGAAGSAIAGGASWLKTSTGFHPRGGATVAAVALLRSIAPPEVGVKASGAIRTRDAALAMLEAGADRIGTSAAPEILG
jgi:deoxyribose-phosphate aldolase